MTALAPIMKGDDDEIFPEDACEPHNLDAGGVADSTFLSLRDSFGYRGVFLAYASVCLLGGLAILLTAPLGLIIIQKLGPKWLEQDKSQGMEKSIEDMVNKEIEERKANKGKHGGASTVADVQLAAREGYRSVEHVMQELEGVKREYPFVDFIWFSDASFFGRPLPDLLNGESPN